MLMTALFFVSTSKSFFKAARTARAVVIFFIDSPQKIWRSKKRSEETKEDLKKQKKI
jgi:hypothetical protein